MQQFSPMDAWRRIDVDRLRKATGELVDLASSYHDTDVAHAAELHSLAADLYGVCASLETARSERLRGSSS